MKKLTKIFVVIITIIGINFAAFADNIPVAAAKPKNFKVGIYNIKQTSKVKLFVEKLKGDRLIIRLKNGGGDVLHLEVLSKKQTSYSCSYDLAALPDGTYQIEVESADEKLTKELAITSQPPAKQIEREISIK